MRILLALLFIGFSVISYSQMDVIKLNNPSFEDTPRKGGASKKIKGWYDCGLIDFPKESAPDIHPGGYWGVKNEPYNGNTYLGLVVRDNETWESVCQKLATKDEDLTPMLGGKCYRISITLLQAENYVSGSRLHSIQPKDNSQIYNYTTPVVLRLWGGNSYCNKRELLAVSNPVINSEWETIDLNFAPTIDYEFITIEAYYNIPVLVPYNGHVLIDNLSDIIQVECED